MARSLTEIKTSLVGNQPGLSTSSTAEWRIWVEIFAYAIWLFEVVMDVFRADVENQLSKKQPGTREWYSEKALAFQNGHTLTVDEWGVVGYAVTDTEAQIVKRASISEAGGTVTIKVAKINAETNELEPLNLTDGEYLNFQRYMDAVKFAGTAVEYRSLPADVVEYDISVYYDPLYLPSEVEANVLAALAAFRTALSFDARLYKTDFVTAVQAVAGVKSVKVNSMTIIPEEGEPVVLDVVEELESGYFNFSDDSVIEMINIDA
ncbi:MAG: hypothetical protein JXQ80_13000 [Bacteroidales bacterium]|nr:hypothetical protein [Bacteroidales bacterium]